MSAHNVIIAEGVKTKIDNDAPGIPYVVTELTTSLTFAPTHEISKLGKSTYIKIVPLAYTRNREREFRNTEKILLDLPVQFAVQERVSITNTDRIKVLLELIEQILFSVEDDELVLNRPRYTWRSSEPIRDENGLTYSHEQLVSEGIFQSIYTVHYQYPLQ